MNLEIEDKYFVKNNGEERHFTDIVQENIDRVSSNYYTGLTTVNDIFVGGMNLHLIMVQSELQYDMEYLIEETNSKNLIQYASGEALDDIGARKGIYRHDAEFATGSVVFTLANSLTSPVEILEGTELTTDDTIIFLTNEDVTIPTGNTEVVCDVICEESGTIGNIKAGTLNNILTVLPYDLTVTNPNDFTNGSDEEEDGSFKDRIIDSSLNYPVGTSKWFEKVAETLVRSALYHKIDGRQGLLVYKPTDKVTDDDLKKLFSQKENQVVNLDVTYQEAKPITVIHSSMTIAIAVSMIYSFDTVANEIRERITKYVDDLPLGEVFNKNCIQFLCESVDGVLGVILDGYEDVVLSNEQYAVIDGDLNIVRG
jgi:phage-related baseplate assembly protein